MKVKMWNSKFGPVNSLESSKPYRIRESHNPVRVEVSANP